jgi:hypothetical protein
MCSVPSHDADHASVSCVVYACVVTVHAPRLGWSSKGTQEGLGLLVAVKQAVQMTGQTVPSQHSGMQQEVHLVLAAAPAAADVTACTR